MLLSMTPSGKNEKFIPSGLSPLAAAGFGAHPRSGSVSFHSWHSSDSHGDVWSLFRCLLHSELAFTRMAGGGLGHAHQVWKIAIPTQGTASVISDVELQRVPLPIWAAEVYVLSPKFLLLSDVGLS